MKRGLLILSMVFIVTLNYGQWTKTYFVDDFGDKTKKAYISQQCSGTFSNSATSGAELTALVIVSYNNYNDTIPMFRIDLFEYGKGPAIRVGGSHCLKVKTSSDSIVHQFRFYFTGLTLIKKVEPAIDTRRKTKREKEIERLEKELHESNKNLGVLDNEDGIVLLELLKNDTLPLKINLRVNLTSSYDGTCSYYNFIINPIGFAEAFNSLK
jgi:hypothetical protein